MLPARTALKHRRCLCHQVSLSWKESVSLCNGYVFCSTQRCSRQISHPRKGLLPNCGGCGWQTTSAELPSLGAWLDRGHPLLGQPTFCAWLGQLCSLELFAGYRSRAASQLDFSLSAVLLPPLASTVWFPAEYMDPEPSQHLISGKLIWDSIVCGNTLNRSK